MAVRHLKERSVVTKAMLSVPPGIVTFFNYWWRRMSCKASIIVVGIKRSLLANRTIPIQNVADWLMRGDQESNRPHERVRSHI